MISNIWRLYHHSCNQIFKIIIFIFQQKKLIPKDYTKKKFTPKTFSKRLRHPKVLLSTFTWIYFVRITNTLKISSLEFKNIVKVNLEKSSMVSRIHFFPLLHWIFMGSQRSMWRSSRNLEILIFFFYSYKDLVCFSLVHASQILLSANFIFVMIWTTSLETNLFRKE